MCVVLAMAGSGGLHAMPSPWLPGLLPCNAVEHTAPEPSRNTLATKHFAWEPGALSPRFGNDRIRQDPEPRDTNGGNDHSGPGSISIGMAPSGPDLGTVPLFMLSGLPFRHTQAGFLSALEREQHRTQAAFIGMALVVAFTLVIIGQLARTQRTSIRLAEQYLQVFEQRFNARMQEKEEMVLSFVLKTREEDRQYMFTELRARMGAFIGSVKQQANALSTQLETLRTDQCDRYDKVCGLLEKGVVEVRQFAHEMTREGIAELGLATALKDLCDGINVEGTMDVELNLFDVEDRLELSMEITAYRIVQDLVSLALKHGHPSELSVALTRTTTGLSIMVSDNGVVSGPADEDFGLRFVRSAVSELDGSIEVNSTPEHGTTVSVELPLL